MSRAFAANGDKTDDLVAVLHLEPARVARQDQVGSEVRAHAPVERPVEQAVELALVRPNRKADGRRVRLERPGEPRFDVNLVSGPAKMEITAADYVPDSHSVDSAADGDDDTLENRQEIGRTQAPRIRVGDTPKGAPLHDVGPFVQAQPVVTGSVREEGADDLCRALANSRMPQPPLPSCNDSPIGRTTVPVGE